MFDEAIKIDPNFVNSYDGKGLNINIITINRIFALYFITIQRSH